MYILLILLYLKSGLVEPRVSIVYGISDDASVLCYKALPETVFLYKKGLFDDGPKPELLDHVKGRCLPVDENENLVSK